MSRDFSLDFSMGNDALADGRAPAECARILREIADKVERGQDDGFIYDANGGKVGGWSAEFPEGDQ